jgi:predicted Zn-dependent protease
VLSILAIALLSIPFSLQFLNNQLDDNFMRKVGANIQEILVTDKNQCKNPDGIKELTIMVNTISNKADEFKVLVVNKKTLNAVALPGGVIVIYQGLLDRFQNPDELAFILGHEIGHLEHEHHKLQFIMGTLLSHINSKLLVLMQLRNSRQAEIEADKFGYNLMLANNIDPQYGIDAFNRLQSKDDDEEIEKLLSYVSTHPVTNDRINIIKEKNLHISNHQKSQFRQSISDESWKKIQNICKH